MSKVYNDVVDRPLTWIGSFPVYVSTLIAAVHAVTLILTALAMAAGAEGLIQAFTFSSYAVIHHGAFWQWATYAFVHPPANLFILLELYLLVMFGRDIERYLGRKFFIQLYLLLLLVPPALLTAAGFLGFSSVLSGSGALHFAVFLAFATLYPKAEIFFSLQARWVAIGLLVFNALQCAAARDLTALGILLLDSGIAVAFTWRARFGTPLFPPRLRIVRERSVKPVRKPAAETVAGPESVDRILEKISRHGISSLTASERRCLEEARAELLAREKTH